MKKIILQNYITENQLIESNSETLEKINGGATCKWQVVCCGKNLDKSHNHGSNLWEGTCTKAKTAAHAQEAVSKVLNTATGHKVGDIALYSIGANYH